MFSRDESLHDGSVIEEVSEERERVNSDSGLNLEVEEMIPRVNHRMYSNYMGCYRTHETEPILSLKAKKLCSNPHRR